jgi:hypothetical protein
MFGPTFFENVAPIFLKNVDSISLKNLAIYFQWAMIK